MSLCESTGVNKSSNKSTPNTFWSKYLPFIGNNTIKFLGLPIQIPHNATKARLQLKDSLNLLRQVDQSLVTSKQKLKLYKMGICPRLNWSLTINQFPISWIEKELEATATRFLKRWAGMVKSSDPNCLEL